MLNLTIENGVSNLTMVDGAGTKHCKSIDLSELVSLLATHTAHDFGLLPPGCRYLAQQGPNTFVVIEMASGPREISVVPSGSRASKYKNVSLPAALFMFMLNKAPDGTFQIVKSSVFAMKNDNIMLSTDGLYHYPAPNIYADHKICWGHNADICKGLRSLSALGGVARRFFSAAFNSDLFSTEHISKAFPWSDIPRGDDLVRGYFEYLNTHTFDKTWLKPAQEQMNSFTKAVKYFQGAE